MESLKAFREVWSVDAEYDQPDGERPKVHCIVAHELWSGRTVRLFGDELKAGPPWSTGFDVLVIAFYLSAEINCFLSLGWELPIRVLDLYAEFRCITNGLPTPHGSGLLAASMWFGVDAIDAADKDSMRQLAMRGGPFTSAEELALLDYCESDVKALVALLPKMLPQINLPQAMLRARYMKAAGRIEFNGIPVDARMTRHARNNWGRIQFAVIREIDKGYGVFIPVGVKSPDPKTTFGQWVIDAAQSAGLTPERLVQAVDLLQQQERESTEDFFYAKRQARLRTKLTQAKINRWEDIGFDCSSYPGLDTEARSIAAAFPELGLGTGYQTGDGIDHTDYAADLWNLLRDPVDHCRQRIELIGEAVELALGSPDYDFQPLRFSTAKFSELLIRNNIPWPRLPTGALDMEDDAFRDQVKSYPMLGPLRELRYTLSQLRLNNLALGKDGRNRCMLSAFRASTGRNQPSNAKFLFGPSVWVRAFIQPEPGMAIAYVDWEQQEFGIAAALSGDVAMQMAYESGDPYLTFAKQASAVPADATKQTHKAEREQFKVCALAVQYGMGEKSLAVSINKSEAHARHLLQLHRQTYPAFWKWSQAAVDHAYLRGYLQTVFGWRVYTGPMANPRSMANFPCQGNGAEMLRLACCLATEAGVRICAPVHDAVLIEAAAEQIEAEVERMQGFMREASEIVLSGFPLRTDAKIIRHPDRYIDPRGTAMWETVYKLLASLPEQEESWS